MLTSLVLSYVTLGKQSIDEVDSSSERVESPRPFIDPHDMSPENWIAPGFLDTQLFENQVVSKPKLCVVVSFKLC